MLKKGKNFNGYLGGNNNIREEPLLYKNNITHCFKKVLKFTKRKKKKNSNENWLCQKKHLLSEMSFSMPKVCFKKKGKKVCFKKGWLRYSACLKAEQVLRKVYLNIKVLKIPLYYQTIF